eukprot:16429180-Heterocapsa_arctica.AAC.1
MRFANKQLEAAFINSRRNIMCLNLSRIAALGTMATIPAVIKNSTRGSWPYADDPALGISLVSACVVIACGSISA